jgi:hypothetical protein
MGASKRTFLGGSLLAMCFLLTGTATALEPDQSGVPPQSSPPLPAFLDDKRSGDLQEAWRAREAEAKEAPQPQGSGASEEPAPKETEAMSAARDAMKRVGEANRQAPAVRQRAEELSRRFGADAGEIPSAAVVAPATSGEPPAGQGGQTVVTAPEPAREGDAAADAEPAGGGGATAALPEPAPEPPDAATQRRPPVPVARPNVHIPPLPLRAPRAVTQDAAMRHYRPAVGSLPATAPAPADNGRVEVFPPYIRAFGWNSQPQ